MDRLIPRHRRKAGSGPPANALIAWIGTDPYLREAAANANYRREIALSLPSQTRSAKAAAAVCFVLTCGAVLGITTIISYGRSATQYEIATPLPRQGNATAPQGNATAPALDSAPTFPAEAGWDPALSTAPVNDHSGATTAANSALPPSRTGLDRPAAQRDPPLPADPITPDDADRPADTGRPRHGGGDKPADTGTPASTEEPTGPGRPDTPEKTTNNPDATIPDKPAGSGVRPGTPTTRITLDKRRSSADTGGPIKPDWSGGTGTQTRSGSHQRAAGATH